MTRFYLTDLALFVLVCACAPCAIGGITPNATATWTGGGGDNNWGTGENWSWSAADCNENNVVPGSITDPTSDCYNPTVNIPDGKGTVNQNTLLPGYISDFTLGSGDVLSGFLGSTGNVTIAGGAVVNGGVSASETTQPGTLPGTLTNKGTINLTGGGVGGCTINNSGTIIGYGSVFTPHNTSQCGNTGTTVTATNTNTIEARGGTLQFGGTWNNAGATIQIDAGATLQANGIITGGSLTNKGGVVVGEVILAGIVSSTSLTVDAPANFGPSEVDVTGTLNNSGALTVGLAGTEPAFFELKNGGEVTTGTTILGLQAGADGNILVDQTSKLNVTGLTIGDSGNGSAQVEGSLVADTINLGFEASGTGSLDVGGAGTVTYTTLHAFRGNTNGTDDAVYINAGGTLTGSGAGDSGPDDSLAPNANADVYGTWNAGNGLTVNGATLTLWPGGVLKVTCPGCGAPGFGTGFGGGALQLTGSATVIADGSGTTISTPGLNVNSPLAVLTVRYGAAANLGVLLTNSTVTVNGTGSSGDGTQITAQTTVYGSGALTVENGAALNASSLTVNGAKAMLVAESSGTVSSNIVKVSAGSATIEPTATLNMTGSPGNLPLISIGDGTAAANLSIGGALNDATTINVFQNGTLQIVDGDSVTLPGLNPRVSLPGGTVDVTQGQLIIGNAVSAGEDWVTVGLLGTLSGGKICPELSSSNPNPGCSPNTLIGGPGHVKDNVSNRGGTVSVTDPTTLDLSGNYTQTSGTLDLAIDGTQSGQYDQLVAGGSIQITGGTVEFDFGNGFAPAAGNAFNLLSGTGGVTVSGTSFTTTGLANGFSYTTNATADQFNLTAQNAATATTSPTPPPTTSGIRQLSSSAAGVPAVAPGSMATVYAASGTTLSTGQPTPSGLPWQTSLNGTSVTIMDATGASTSAPLLYVSASQVNFLIPDSVALGPATVTVTSGTQTVATGQITVTALAPALFTLNSANLAAAYAECISSSGAQTVEDPFQVVNGAIQAQPLNLNACAETILQLYATGLDTATAANVQATIGNATATVQSAGPGGMWPGLDEVDVVIPLSLAGAGSVPVIITAGGVSSNPVNVTIQ